MRFPLNLEHVRSLLSIQPFWQAEKIRQDILWDQHSELPLAYLYELEAGDTDGLDCVPGIGLIGILFSLDQDKPGAVCCGTLSQSKMVPLYGMSHVFACQFFPGEFSRIFHLSSKDLANREAPLSDLLPVGSFPEQIAAARSFDERKQHLLAFIRERERLSRDQTFGRLTQTVMYNILHQHGNIRMIELEKQTGYCSRYLHQVLSDQVGLPPKTAIDNIRFQGALRMMMEHPCVPIAEVAQRCGYYDQSHFTKTFKKYVGVTPAAFERVKNYAPLPLSEATNAGGRFPITNTEGTNL